jgi:hypothetical protein
MTQEQLDTLVEMWCLTAQESLGDYELEVKGTVHKGMYQVNVECEEIDNYTLPFEYIYDTYTPKEKVKIIISLLKQIIENGDQWLQDELDYHGDKLAENGDNDYKSNLENN